MTYSAWTAPRELGNRLDPFRYDPVYTNAQHRVESGGLPFETLEGQTTAPVNYGILQPRVFTVDGVPMVRAVDLGDPFISPLGVVKVPYDVERPYHRSRLGARDVLLSIAGTLGRVGIVPEGWDLANVNQSVARIRTAKTLDSYYLATYLMTPIGRQLVEREAVGSVQRHLNIEDTRALRIPFPDLSIQRAIGNKLRKAERLREMASSIRASAAQVVTEAFGPLPALEDGDASWVDVNNLSDGRVDAWFHQRAFLAADRLLRRRENLIQVKSLCKLPRAVAHLSKWTSNILEYFEIGRLNVETGEAVPIGLRPSDAPSRAKYLVTGGDVLVSTVRPNLRAIGQISSRYSQAVCSSGFCILRADEPAIGAFVRMCLVQDAATMQLMRWNTGGTYPAIERNVPGLVWIPNLRHDRIQEIGQDLLNASRHTEEVSEFVRSAVADVEALVIGALDIAATAAEGDRIEQWLHRNPNPNAAKEKSHARID